MRQSVTGVTFLPRTGLAVYCEAGKTVRRGRALSALSFFTDRAFPRQLIRAQDLSLHRRPMMPKSMIRRNDVFSLSNGIRVGGTL